MYCKNCGKEISNDAIFCSGCGIRIDNERVKPTVDEQTVDQEYYSTLFVDKDYRRESSCNNKQDNGRRRGKDAVCASRGKEMERNCFKLLR